MRLSHLLIAGATAVSFSAFAADEQKSQDPQQPQAQSSQSQEQSQGAQQSMSQETVKQVQQKLSAAGHQIEVDGIMGPKTQAALKEYQQKQGMQATGQLNQETLAALGVSEGASASTGSTGAQESSSSGGSASEGKSSEKKY
jgi:peptidoglycan hydrolase-like protein with peptidoglycan-binding domain